LSNSPHGRRPQEYSPSPRRDSFRNNILRTGSPRSESSKQKNFQYGSLKGGNQGAQPQRSTEKIAHQSRHYADDVFDRTVHPEDLHQEQRQQQDSVGSGLSLTTGSLSSASTTSSGPQTARGSRGGRRLLSVSRNLQPFEKDLDAMQDLDTTFLTGGGDQRLRNVAPSDVQGNRSGTSKGSSFTDLSEASVSQSALEDALYDLSASSSAKYEGTGKSD
jgi:hypothetical protein